MREALGLVALNGGYLAVGATLLFGLGLVRTPGAAVRLAGLALVAGWALTGIATSLALVAGLGLVVGEVVFLWASLSGGSVMMSCYYIAW